MFGEEICRDAKNRIIAYFHDPNIDSWNNINTIIINDKGKICTVWQAWIDVDSTAPLTGRVTNNKGEIIEEWKKIPDVFMLYKALRYGIEDFTGESDVEIFFDKEKDNKLFMRRKSTGEIVQI